MTSGFIRLNLRYLVALFVGVAWIVTPTLVAAQQPDSEEPPAQDSPDVVTFGPNFQGTLSETSNPCDDGQGIPASQQMVPGDCIDGLPSYGYDIGYDEGAWNHFSRKVTGTITGLAFDTARAITDFAIWILDWAFSFGAGELLREPVVAMAESFDTHLIGPLDIGGLAFAGLIFWVAITSLRGKTAHAFGELVVSLVMIVVFGLLTSNMTGYMNGAFDTTGALSSQILSAALDDDPNPPGVPIPGESQNPTAATNSAVDPIRETLHETFVEVPYDLLNWGTTSFPAACRQVRDLAVASGPHGADDLPRNAMEQAGCPELADFNHKPTGTRMVGAMMAALAAVLLLGLVALVSLTVIVAQVVMALVFAVLPFAAAAAALPGSGRNVAIKWATSILRAMLAVIAMSFLLAIMLLLIQAVLTVDSGPDGSASAGGLPLYARYMGVIVSIGGAIVARKRILAAGEGFTNRMSASAAAARPGSGQSSGPAKTEAGRANGASGMNIAQRRPGAQPSRTSQLASRRMDEHRKTRRSSKAQNAATKTTDHVAHRTSTAGPKGGVGARHSGGHDAGGGWRSLPRGRQPAPDGKIPQYRRNKNNVAGLRDPRAKTTAPASRGNRA